MSKKQMREATNGPKRASAERKTRKSSITDSVYYESENGNYTADKSRSSTGASGVYLNAQLNSDGTPKNFSISDNGDVRIKESWTTKVKHG